MFGIISTSLPSSAPPPLYLRNPDSASSLFPPLGGVGRPPKRRSALSSRGKRLYFNSSTSPPPLKARVFSFHAQRYSPPLFVGQKLRSQTIDRSAEVHSSNPTLINRSGLGSLVNYGLLDCYKLLKMLLSLASLLLLRNRDW